MSLILDALNRSRTEHGDVPNLDTVHTSPEAADESARPWHLWLALALALGVITWLLADRSGPGEGDNGGPAAVAVPVAAAPAKPAEPPREAATAPPAAVPGGGAPADHAPAPASAPPEVAHRPDPAVAALYAKEGVTRSAAPAGPGSVSAPREPVQAAAGSPAANTVGEPAGGAEEQSVDIEKMILQAEGDLENARLEEHSAPFLSSLSQARKDSIPTILYERHDYSGRPGQSRVLLNGQSLGEGGATRGVRVEEILPDSVVLNYQGSSFRLRALNSWVNL